MEALSKAIESSDWYTRGNAVKMLAEFQDESVLECLLERVTDRSEYVRSNVVEALGRSKDPRVVESLIRLLKDPYWYVRGKAAEALGEVGNERGIAPLIEALDSGEDWSLFVRRNAASALVKIGRPALKALEKALEDRNSDVRSAVAWILGEIGEKESLELLRRKIADADSRVSFYVAEALEKIDQEKCLTR